MFCSYFIWLSFKFWFHLAVDELMLYWWCLFANVDLIGLRVKAILPGSNGFGPTAGFDLRRFVPPLLYDTVYVLTLYTPHSPSVYFLSAIRSRLPLPLQYSSHTHERCDHPIRVGQATSTRLSVEIVSATYLSIRCHIPVARQYWYPRQWYSETPQSDIEWHVRPMSSVHPPGVSHFFKWWYTNWDVLRVKY